MERKDMQEFNQLIEIADTLLGENGCPWDREQTLFSLQPFLKEELHELLEAIDRQDPEHIAEEAGDLFFNIIFIAKIAEKEKMFALKDVLDKCSEKLIRRHPHIFGDTQKLSTPEEVLKKWEKIKTEEKKGAKEKENHIFQVPPGLDLLSRAYFISTRLKRVEDQYEQFSQSIDNKNREEEWAEKLWQLIGEAVDMKISPEDAFRRYFVKLEQRFKEAKKSSTGDDLEA